MYKLSNIVKKQTEDSRKRDFSRQIDQANLQKTNDMKKPKKDKGLLGLKKRRRLSALLCMNLVWIWILNQAGHVARAKLRHSGIFAYGRVLHDTKKLFLIF
jgi:hypothetical protein